MDTKTLLKNTGAIILLLVLVVTSAAVQADIIYVDVDATGNGDGTSWTDAYNYLQDALLDDAGSGDEIWVAEGTYYPDEGDTPTEDDRTETFQLVDGAEVYGGFDPTIGDDTWAERDYIKNVTILSGDIDQDEDPNGDSYHVVTGADNATIDGFTITSGYANGSDTNFSGAGMLNIEVSPTVKNCSFISNATIGTPPYYIGGGGGMFNHSCNSIITGCTFYDNSSAKSQSQFPDLVGRGGAMYNYGDPAPTITNCVFSTNFSRNYGGAITNFFCKAIITNCTFTKNLAGAGGAIYCDYGSDSVITNCILWDDFAVVGPEIYTHPATPPVVTYSDVEGGWYGTGNINSDPCFVNPDANDFHLDWESPCINAGDPNGDYTGQTDIDGEERASNTVEIGADELQECMSSDANEYDDWLYWERPECWCYQKQCRGDTDSQLEFNRPVGLLDLNLLNAAFGKIDADLAQIPNGICADLDHIAHFNRRVALSDLNILQDYFGKDDQNVPTCDETPIITGPFNFWTD